MSNISTDVSPLAQRLAEAYDVDLAILKEKYLDSKITARNVLEHLSTSDEQPLPKRKRLKSAEPARAATTAEPTGDLLATEAAPMLKPTPVPDQGGSPSNQLVEAKASAAEPKSAVKSVPRHTDDPALAQARAQLQATAGVHQQALMEVGSLRQQNHALDAEVERLRMLAAQAQADLEQVEQGKRQLELELERSKSTVKPLSWLRRLIS